MTITANMCTLDRTARTVIGIVFIYIGFMDTYLDIDDLIRILLGIFGIINIGSAYLAFCPIYKLANLSTLKKKTHPE